MALTMLPAAGKEAGKDSLSWCADSIGGSHRTDYLGTCSAITHLPNFLPSILLFPYPPPERSGSQISKDSYTLKGLVKKAEPQGKMAFNS